MSAKKSFETRKPAPSITPSRMPHVTAPIAARFGPSATFRTAHIARESQPRVCDKRSAGSMTAKAGEEE